MITFMKIFMRDASIVTHARKITGGKSDRSSVVGDAKPTAVAHLDR